MLCHCTEPEEIILFGSLAEAVPFSEIAAYDLFVLTANRFPEDWDSIRSYLKFELPSRTRTISFIKLYICTPADICGDLMPFSIASYITRCAWNYTENLSEEEKIKKKMVIYNIFAE